MTNRVLGSCYRVYGGRFVTMLDTGVHCTGTYGIDQSYNHYTSKHWKVFLTLLYKHHYVSPRAQNVPKTSLQKFRILQNRWLRVQNGFKSSKVGVKSFSEHHLVLLSNVGTSEPWFLMQFTAHLRIQWGFY